MATRKRKLYTGKRGGKYYLRKGRRVYISRRRGAFGTAEARLWHADWPEHPVHHA